MKRIVLKQRGSVKLEKVNKMYVVVYGEGKTYGVTPNLTQAEIWFEEA